MLGEFGAGDRSRPLYEIKANLFKALAHPLRIRILEVLTQSAEAVPVSGILGDVGVEAALLSQHLAVLKRHRVVAARRIGNAVYYELAHPKIAELLAIARTFLADTLADQQAQFAQLPSLPPIGMR